MSDDDWMRLALREADLASSVGEVPIGCVIMDRAGAELSRGHNLRETRSDPTAHAEVVALQAAAVRIGGWRLDGAVAFVTLEPCPMCAGAFINARVARVVYGCDDPKAGALHTLYTLGQDARLNHRFAVTRGVLSDECAERLRAFFLGLRALGQK